MFGISIFSQPQYFIGLYLGLFSKTQDAISQLGILLTRTKNPPISVIYTHQFLKQKTQQEYALNIIRFLSQLSDLSGGTSMSSSLQNIIGESSFLTQIRHNLTHKIKISNYLIETSRKIILKELKQQYWDVNYIKIMQTYQISIERVNYFYRSIYNQELSIQNQQKLQKEKRKVTFQWLKNQSSNYQFKQFFNTFFKENSQAQTQLLIKQISSHKKSIAISNLIRLFCFDNKNEQLCQLLRKILRKQQPNIFNQKLVFDSLKKLTFIHYIGLCSKVLIVIPPNVLNQLDKFWRTKQELLRKNKEKAKIYNIFQKEDYLDSR